MPETPLPKETEPKLILPTGPGATFTFFYYFSGVALITALFTAETLGLGFSSRLSGQIGILGGAIAGLLGLHFNRTQTLTLTPPSPQALAQQLAAALSEMGYTCAETEGTVSLYQRSPWRRFFAGDIFLQQEAGTFTLVSRAANIRRLTRVLQLPPQDRPSP